MQNWKYLNVFWQFNGLFFLKNYWLKYVAPRNFKNIWVNMLIFFLQPLEHLYPQFTQSSWPWENVINFFFFQHSHSQSICMLWNIVYVFVFKRKTCEKISIPVILKSVWKCSYACIKYDIMKRIMVRNQNLLNLQKITHWFATNAILLIQGLYNNTVLNW